MPSAIDTSPADTPDVKEHTGRDLKKHELFGLARIIYIAGDTKTVNPSTPRRSIKYRVFKTLATHSTPQRQIYGGELRCHRDGQPSHAGWVRREEANAFIELVEDGYEIEATVGGKPELFVWNGERCYRAMIYWEVLPGDVV
ncbi:hypothetical protein DFP73DRAFT_530068 [Morchella snyderi]|nr:hypothetical protein DFP73DRAFT_530068 [Morchella snyderi]